MNVYDFDGTVFHGDSTMKFCFFVIPRRPYVLLFSPIQGIAWLLNRMHIINVGTMKRMLLSYLIAIDTENLVDKFWKGHYGQMKKWYMECKRGDDVIITAAPRFLVEPVCEKIGVKNLIATEVSPKTGYFHSRNCRGKEKVRRFRERFGDARIEKFFTDSEVDRPMAEIADEAYLVKGETVTKWDLGTI